MSSKDTPAFWKNWRSLYSKNASSCAPVVDGISFKGEIADHFKQTFMANSKPNDSQKVEELDAKFLSRYRDFSEDHDKSCNCNPVSISLSVVVDAICGMKSGKCADEEDVSAEHFHNAPLNLLERLTFLFNCMLNHAFVPSQFRLGFMIPLIKDRLGNKSDVQNYRGITISPIMSKVFEHVLKLVYCDYLTTSPHQFGFKKKSSTVQALYCLRETVTYYVNHGSRVFCSFLDASKAFDRLVHSGLFLKLMERGVPKAFLDIIITWYDGLQCRVKWDGHFSDWFVISAGVRQGGVLSPEFYCIYVNDLLLILKQRGVGCYYLNSFAAALFYADDMAILAPSLRGLQTLLDICSRYCRDWDICLNAKKTKNIFFGRKCSNLATLTLDGKSIAWEENCVYLGVTLKSGKNFSCSVVEQVRKFYRCANAILRIDGRSDDLTMLSLLESHCLPILTYGIEMIYVSDRAERRKMRVAYNSIFRKIFHYRYRESVTALQGHLGRLTWEQLMAKRRTSFVQKALSCPPDSLLRVICN